MQLSLLVCSVLFLSSFSPNTTGQKQEKPVTLFSVNKRPVTVDEFIYLYKKNHQIQKGFHEEKIKEYLDLVHQFQIESSRSKKPRNGYYAGVFKRVQWYRDELRKPYLPDAKLTDSLMRLTYARMKEEVKASHILVALKPDASPEDTLKATRKLLDYETRS